MTLELMSLPLALLAGMLSILSPCIWPLVPVVMSSAATVPQTSPLLHGTKRNPDGGIHHETRENNRHVPDLRRLHELVRGAIRNIE